MRSRFGPAGCHRQSENATKCLLTHSMLIKIIAVDILTIIVRIQSHHTQTDLPLNRWSVALIIHLWMSAPDAAFTFETCARSEHEYMYIVTLDQLTVIILFSYIII